MFVNSKQMKAFARIGDMDLDKLETVAVLAAREAGEALLSYFKSAGLAIRAKADDSPVTKADMAAHHAVIKNLSETNIPILSEEDYENVDHRSEYLWVIDPLDGTKDFIAGLDQFAVMIGLLKGDRPILGVVYAPVLNDVGTLWSARHDKPTSLQSADARRELANVERNFDKPRLLTSRKHFKPEMQTLADRCDFELVKTGSNGVKLGLLAEGQGQVFYNSSGHLGIWDLCGPELLVTSLGGKVTDVYGDSLDFRSSLKIEKGVVATLGVDHDEVIAVTKDLGVADS